MLPVLAQIRSCMRPRDFLLLFVFVFSLISLCQATNKYSKAANQPKIVDDEVDATADWKSIDKPFRLAKINLIWAKAQKVIWIQEFFLNFGFNFLSCCVFRGWLSLSSKPCTANWRYRIKNNCNWSGWKLTILIKTVSKRLNWGRSSSTFLNAMVWMTIWIKKLSRQIQTCPTVSPTTTTFSKTRSWTNCGWKLKALDSQVLHLFFLLIWCNNFIFTFLIAETELKTLKEEFVHHQEKVLEFYGLLEEHNSRKLREESKMNPLFHQSPNSFLTYWHLK